VAFIGHEGGENKDARDSDPGHLYFAGICAWLSVAPPELAGLF